MNKDVYGILGDLTAEILLEIIAECMDDYLYVIDLQNNKMEISQSALDRFMISETHVRNVSRRSCPLSTKKTALCLQSICRL